MKEKIKKRIGELSVDETIKILEKMSKSKSLTRNFVYLFKNLIAHLMFLYTETYNLRGKDRKSISMALDERKKIQNYILAQGREEEEI